MSEAVCVLGFRYLPGLCFWDNDVMNDVTGDVMGVMSWVMMSWVMMSWVFSGCHVILRLCFLELCFFHNDFMDDVMSMMLCVLCNIFFCGVFL